MSASAIMDAVETMVGAASFMGAANVGRNYGVLESAGASAAVIEGRGLEQVEDSVNHTHQADWIISVRFFSKDTDGPTALANRTACMIDLSACTFRADPTLLGTVNRVTRFTVDRELPPEGFVVAGGATWQETPTSLAVEEWPNG